MPFNELQVPALKGDLQRVQTLLLETIQAYRDGSLSTREDVLQAYAEVISLFENTLEGSLYEYVPVVPDTEPSIQWRNDLALGINRDLVLLFFEMNQLATLMTGIFNQEVSERDDLIGRIKRVKSLLGDYELISGEGGISIGDSFINTDNLSIGSTLISTEEAEVNTTEGAVTATETEITTLEIESISIDSANSNGILGNNEETGVTDLHNDLNDIVDGTPDSWTEYEQVVFQDSVTEALTLRLILKLSEQSIVNRIEIDPVNFGQLNSVQIDDIRVSADGETWLSIAGDLPLADYLGETEESTFILSPESSRFSGKFVYTFLPRKVSHVAIDLRQDTGFLIDTENGSKLRFVIGVKAIDLFSVKFASNSQLVSNTLTASGVIKKLALLAAYRPVSSDLGSIVFSVSFDGGTTWTDVQPLTEDDLSAAEVLTLDTVTDNFIYKMTFTRNDSAFSELDDFDETITETTTTVFESRQVATTTSPVVITPNQQMASDDVVIMNSPIGSRSSRRRPGLPRFHLGEGTGDALTVQLPFDLVPDTSIKKSAVRVFVAGQRWTRLEDEAALDAAATDDRVYYINDDNEIVFGDGDPINSLGNGKSPAAGAEITVALPAETLYFVATDGGYVATTDLASSGNKKASILERVGQLSVFVSEILTAGDTEIELQNSHIDENNFFITERDEDGNNSPTAFVTEKSNLSEVTATGHYYVDYVRGVIYTFSSASTTATITYKYYPVEEIDDYEWRIDEDGKFGGVFISDDEIVIDSWEDITGEAREPYDFSGTEDTPNPANVSDTATKLIVLSQPTLIAGTLVLEDGIFGTGVVPVEVEFVDGNTELQRTTATTAESLAPIAVSSPGVFTIQLAGGPNISKINGVVFSDTTIFATEVVGAPSSDGEYNIDFTTGEVDVYLSADMSDDITASYYVKSTSASTDGRYSVDYERGRIYTFNTVEDGFKVTYNYTKYRVHYPVARALASDEYTVDVERNTISINTEQLVSGDIQIAYPFDASSSATLSELIEFYTPVIRDIRWRILTEGM